MVPVVVQLPQEVTVVDGAVPLTRPKHLLSVTMTLVHLAAPLFISVLLDNKSYECSLFLTKPAMGRVQQFY